MEQIRFRFTGGIADDHEMNFYEFGRFQYGAARFVYTLEKFRQEGRVLETLRSRVHTDIRVKASTEGSFLQDVLIVAAPIITECVIQCSFEAIFAYIWDKILPPSKGEDVAVEIAKQEVRREEQRTLQEHQRTEQMRLMAEVANNNNATTQQALKIIDSALERSQTIQVNEQTLTREMLLQYQRELNTDLSRKRLIHTNQMALAHITPQLEQKLSSQLRKSFGDIAKPLASSATEMEIYTGPRANHKVASIDEATASRIIRAREDDEMTLVRGSIKSYDRESYNGKLRYEELVKPIAFSIRAADKQEVGTKVLEAMRTNEVWLRMYLIRDTYGTPVSAVLEDIVDEDEF